MASTAATLTSTTPEASPKSRMTFSSRSVGTLLAFFGQHTHTIPLLTVRSITTGSRFSSRANEVVNSSVTSISRGRRVVYVDPPSSSSRWSGAPSTYTFRPGLRPSFCGSGVPE